MSCLSLSASAANRGRSFAVVLFLSASVAGCFSDPKVNVGAIQHCKTNDSCPSGYVCTVNGTCCASANGLTCTITDASTQTEAGGANSIDTSTGELGSANPIDVPAVDSSQDTSLGSTDGPTAIIDTAIPDLGVGTGGAPGRDSGSGSGGASGAEGGMDAALDSALDVPQGTGGIVGSGGTGTGGAPGTGGNGGAIGTGGTPGSGGAPGTGGTTAACQGSATQCSGTTNVQTCTNGQWGTPVSCGAHQTCTGPVGTAQCTCGVDPLCTSVGTKCTNGGSTVLTCAKDAQNCLYSSSQDCTNGACYVSAGTAMCCTNACAVGTACLSSTSLQTCDTGSNGCTAPTTSNCSSGLVCERYGTDACADPNWAEWPMPNSQADVTAGAPNLEGYTDNGTTVTDNVTGLMWQKAAPSATYTWAAAVAYCPGINLGGYADWRLPTLIELFSIVDAGKANPSIDGAYFPSTPAALFWSSSPAIGSSGSYAFAVNFTRGDIFVHGDMSSATYNIRCVR